MESCKIREYEFKGSESKGINKAEREEYIAKIVMNNYFGCKKGCEKSIYSLIMMSI